MELEITTIFVLCEEVLTAMNIREDAQIQMNNAEVMTVPFTAARFFHGHQAHARVFLTEQG